MKRATFNVIYFINRTKKLKNGSVPIYASITVNKQRAEFAVGRYIDPADWNIENNRVQVGVKAAKEINSYLELVRSNLLLNMNLET